MSRAQILRLLGHAGLRQILSHRGAGGLFNAQGQDDDDYDDGFGGVGRRRRRPKGTPVQLPPVPNPEGEKLMDSGIFGTNSYCQDVLRKRKKRMARRLMSRELGANAKRENNSMAQVREVEMFRVILLILSGPHTLFPR